MGLENKISNLENEFYNCIFEELLFDEAEQYYNFTRVGDLIPSINLI